MIPLMLIMIKIKQDGLEGGPWRESNPGPFPPQRFLESLGAEQCPAHRANFWGWDNSSEGLLNVPKNRRKLSKVEKQKIQDAK